MDKTTVRQPLYGHTSQETAYLVEDYPYSFRLRCKIRYWIEENDRHGFRFCSQTTNPRKDNAVWNKPKCGTYVLLSGCMYLDEKDHVQWAALGGYDSAEAVLTYIRTFSQAPLDRVRAFVAEKIRYMQGKLDGRIVMTMNGKPCEYTEYQKNEDAIELGRWRTVAEEALKP